MANDLRFALRQMRKKLGITIVIVLTLGLGLGINTGMFSALEVLLIRPLPFPNPSELVRIMEIDSSVTVGKTVKFGPSFPDFTDWRDQNKVFQSLAIYFETPLTLTGKGSPIHLDGEQVSADFFSVLGVEPLLGRNFLLADEKGAHVAILSHSVWRARFNSDPKIIGSLITLSGTAYIVVGVMPPKFDFPLDAQPVEIWSIVDTTQDVASQRGSHHFHAIGRLRSGVTLKAATADMNRIAAALASTYPQTNGQHPSVEVISEREFLAKNSRDAVLMLYVATVLVLVVACANVASLLVAASSSRQREIAVRAALGAQRSQLVSGLLIESAVITVVAALLGVGLVTASFGVLRNLLPFETARLYNPSLGWIGFVYAAVMAFVTAVAVGLIPALKISTPNLNFFLRSTRDSSLSIGEARINRVLIITETALGLLLIICSGLLIRSYSRLREVNLGFDPRNILTFSIDFPADYTKQRQITLYQSLMDRLGLLPGVSDVGGVFPLPLKPGQAMVGFRRRGESSSIQTWPLVRIRTVSTNYFKTMRIPIIKGHVPEERDAALFSKAVVVNQAFVARYLSELDPIGMTLQTRLDRQSDGPRREIVAVVADIKQDGLATETEPELYVLYNDQFFGDLSLVVRAQANPKELIPLLRQEIEAIDSNVSMFDERTVEDYVSRILAQPRFTMYLLAMFSGSATVLAAVGVYGAVAISVMQRRQEIGIRMALGARRIAILCNVTRQGLSLSAIGLSTGLVAAAFFTRLLTHVLFGVTPLDPFTLIVSLVGLIAVVFLAVLVPSIQHTALDPAETLQNP